MPKSLPKDVTFPWIKVVVPVETEFTQPTGEEHHALARMERWSDELRRKIELACFADYLDKVHAIGAEPPTVPTVKEPAEVWRHLEIKSVRAQGRDLVVVYAVPEWAIEEQHEWCINGDDLVYVGQVLCYYPDAYLEIACPIVTDCDRIIGRLKNLPLNS